MTAASIYTIKELTAKFGRWAVNSFFDDLIKEIARCLVPDMIAFFETEEAKREFEAWKLEQKKKEEKHRFV